ncbi:MAG: HD domain-containing protein [Oscillospiraceae bacterium]|jgi:tRNA nucleotidyltransferase (CCA-adding enzyme)|nr:HD domain-containing protein [Oscillospiraceae bacterium]
MNLSPTAQKAINTLEQAGFEAFIVGGSVRDLLMGKPPKDIDITTNALPAQTKEAFQGFTVIETGLKHGTVTVLIEGEPVEITTYRIESDYSDNRHPDSVAFTQNLREDLARRDFTINALAMDSKGTVQDFFGGREDIAAGLIRCVGDADERFNEDGLRILRGLRFASVLGFSIDSRTAEAIHKNRDLLKNISAERVFAELSKAICGVNIEAVLKEYNDVFVAIIPEFKPAVGFLQHNKHHCFDVWEHTARAVHSAPAEPVIRWAALLHDIGKPYCFTQEENGTGHFYGHPRKSKELSADIMERLKFDSATRDKVLLLVALHDNPIPNEKPAIKRFLNKHGKETMKELLSLQHADNLAQAPAYRGRQAELDSIEHTLEEVIAEESCFSLKQLAVNGNDLIQLGLKGTEIGEALNQLLELVIEGAVENDRDVLLELVKAE